MSHTPGPWDVFRVGPMRSICAGTQPIADIYRGGGKGEESVEADAILIAEAPALLKALRHVADEIRGQRGDDGLLSRKRIGYQDQCYWAQVEGVARAAIAKAEAKP